METIANPWLWVVFFTLVLVMLAIDLFWVGRGPARKVSVREAAIWSGVWISLSLLFAAGLWMYLDASAGRELANQKTIEYLTGYLIEKSLAIDNVFVWLMIFGYFAIPAELQKRVLVLGVLGAIVLRTIMIFAGVWLIAKFHWLLYVFGAFLLLTGIKMWFTSDSDNSLGDNKFVKWLQNHLKLTKELHGEKFFVYKEEAGKVVRYGTPLLLVLILVELSDVIFAVDSIPAIFAITTDPFIVLTSNIMAILGLRSMYFLLADMADRFSLLKYGLALVLVLIGTKMLLIDLVKIPVAASLAAVAAIIGTSILLSLKRSRQTPSSN